MELVAEALATKISAYRALLDPPRRKIERRRWAEAQEAMGAKAVGRGGGGAPLIWARFQDRLGDLLQELAALEKGAAAQAALRRAASAYEATLSLSEGRRSGSGWTETQDKLDKLRGLLARKSPPAGDL